jgi:IclR family acetate operon transcriptional repressor
MLAFSPPQVIQRVLSRKLEKLTKRTITSAAALREELAVIRRRGYAVDAEESAVGLRCVAAPIFDRSGIAVAAFSMSAPAGTLDADGEERYSTIIREAALRVSAQTGYRPVTSNLQSLL